MLSVLLLNGITIGSIYALVTLGFVLTYRSIDAFNFFHGELYMLGAFGGYLFVEAFGWPVVLSAIIAIGSTALLGITLERIAIRPLLSAPRYQIIFATAMLGLIIRHSVMLYTEGNPKIFPQYLPPVPLHIGGLRIKPQAILIIGLAILLMVTIYVILNRTKLGKAMRASASNPTAAVLMGIDVGVMQMLTFGLASVLGAIAGVVAAPLFIVDSNMGLFMIVKVFCVGILGGLRSTTGAVVAGYFLGITENLVGGYISPNYQDAVAFIIIIVVLLVRPTGIMGVKLSEKV